MKVSMCIVVSFLVSLLIGMMSGCRTRGISVSEAGGDVPAWEEMLAESPDDSTIDWSRLHYLTNRVSLFTVESQPPAVAVKLVLDLYVQEHPDSPSVAYVMSTAIEDRPPITASLTNAPLGLILQAIADVGGYNISVLYDRSVLIFRDVCSRLVETRIVRVPDAFLRAIGVQENGSRKELKAWFTSRGVYMPDDADAYYLPEIGSLILQNEPRELEIMDALLTLAQRASDSKRR